MSGEELRSLTKEIRTLRLQVENTEQELWRRDNSPPSSHTTPRNISPLCTLQYRVEDKVIISNRVTAPLAHDAAPDWNPTIAKQATVTRVTPNRVYLRTRYGINTWRAPGNVTPA